MVTGQEKFPGLADAFSALEELIATVDQRVAGGTRPSVVSVYVFGSDAADNAHGGIRVAEIGSWWDTGNGTGSGASWMRSDPGCGAAILAAEDFLLCFGYEPEGWNDDSNCPNYDPANDSRWKLIWALTAGATRLDGHGRDALYRDLAIPRTKPT